MYKVDSPVSGDNIDERRTEIIKVSDEEIWNNNQRVAVTEVFIWDENSEVPEHYHFVEAVDAITGRMGNGFYPTAKYNLAHLSEGYESDQAYKESDVKWYALWDRDLWNFAEHLQTAPVKIVEMEAFDQAMTAIMRNSPRNSSNKDLVGFARKGGKSSAVKRGSKTLKQAYGELVGKATKKYGGNVTVQRDGVDLFRVHQTSSGHGFKVTQFKNNVGANGRVFKNNIDVNMRKTHFDQLRRALNGDPRYTIRTRGGQ